MGMLLTLQKIPTHRCSLCLIVTMLYFHRIQQWTVAYHQPLKRSCNSTFSHHVLSLPWNPFGHRRAYHCLWQCLSLVGSSDQTSCAVSGFFSFFLYEQTRFQAWGRSSKMKCPLDSSMCYSPGTWPGTRPAPLRSHGPLSLFWPRDHVTDYSLPSDRLGGHTYLSEEKYLCVLLVGLQGTWVSLIFRSTRINLLGGEVLWNNTRPSHQPGSCSY